MPRTKKEIVPVTDEMKKDLAISEAKVQSDYQAHVEKKVKKVKEPKATTPPPSSPVEKKEKKENAWVSHVKTYRDANPTVSYKEALKNAKTTYKLA